ncbi:MAG: efflux RND transporter periplasmic adaptor subunit [Brumimicrobium sp.]|nr:efflux RND transporter periplasmic adaptor subunit [Brumimicrobium sp.]
MKKIVTPAFLILTAIAVFSCGPKGDIEKLKEKRAELKSELSELDEKIRSLDTSKEMRLPLVKPGEVKIGKFEHHVIVQGDVITDKAVTINAEANGIIQSVEVKEGQRVRTGQVLARIDTEILQRNIEELKTRLDFAEYTYNKQKELKQRGVGTEFELEQAENQYEALQYQLKTLKAQQAKTIVKAPFDGVVDEIFMHQGEMAGVQAPLLRLVNNSNVRIVGNISEAYYTKVKEGSIAKAYFPTLKDTLNLKISSIGNFIHPTNRTFRVQADVENNKVLLPNMLAELQVTDLSLDSAVIVPARAVLKSQNNEDYIFILNKKDDAFKAEKIFVEIISQQKGETAIRPKTRALKEGEKVVIDGGRGITENDIVRTF